MAPKSDTTHSDLAYFIFLWIGMGNLLPWNALITPAEYFYERFCGTPYEYNFLNYFSISFMIAQIVGLGLAVKYQVSLSLSSRIVFPLVIYVVIFSFLAVLVLVKDVDGVAFFWLHIFLVFLCGLCGALLSGGIFGLSGLFPGRYTQAVMAGQGVAGVFASVASLVSIASAPETDICSDDDANDDGDCPDYNVDQATLAYFATTALVLVSCIAAFFILVNLPITIYYTCQDETVREGLLDKTDHDSLNEYMTDLDRQISKEDKRRTRGGQVSRDSQTAPTRQLLFSDIFRLFKIVLVPAMSVWFIFTVTIALFPSVTAKIYPEAQCHSNSRFFNDLFIPFYFLVFNFFDLVGRSLAGYPQSYITSSNIWIFSLVRIVFFPLFLLCAVSESHLPTEFHNVAFPIIFMILFASSNGYISSLCMMQGPSLVELSWEKEAVGTIMVFMLTLGLACGASSSFLALALITS